MHLFTAGASCKILRAVMRSFAALALVALAVRCAPAPEAEPPGAPELVEDYPAFSPDGRRLAFAASEKGDVFGGHWDVFLLDVEAGDRRRLTTHPGDDRFPSFSPSGEELAFWSDRDGGGYFRVALEGDGVRRVGGSPSFASGPAVWSPRGDELALVVRGASGVALEIVSAASNERLALLPLAGDSTRRFDLSGSPDGRFFAFVDGSSLTAHVTTIYVLDRTTGESVAVTDGWTNDWSPFWSPDGASLFFVSNRGGSRDLWRQAISGSRPRGAPERVTEGLSLRHASLSPSGERLAVSRGGTAANVWRAPLLPDRPARWEDAEPITTGDAFVEYLSLSPDGEHLVTTSDASGNPDLWIVDVDDGEARRLTDDPTPDWGPSWSADGAWIAFYAYRSGNRDLWVLPAAGGEAHQITTNPAADMYPHGSPDGTELVFYSVRSGNRDLWLVPFSGGEARQLTDDPGDDLFPIWSPTGDRIAFFSDRDGTGRIWGIDPRTGATEPLSEGPGRFARFTPDGARLLFTGWAERLGNVFERDLASRVERPVTDLAGRPGNLGSYALDTDGRWLYFTWERSQGRLSIRPAPP